MKAIGTYIVRNITSRSLIAAAVISTLFVTLSSSAADSNIFVQCPKDTGTVIHPTANDPGIKCAHLVAGDGMVTMADEQNKEQYVFGYALLPDNDINQPDVNSAEFANWVMDKGTLSANIPAPMIVLDEDDEFFLTLTNVGMVMRPDLFDAHTIHWHGFPEAASIFDGVPDSSIAVTMGASLTYYYNTKNPGTYLYHCHVEATEHMQMGMMGSLYVRPKQNRLADGTVLGTHTHSNPDSAIHPTDPLGNPYGVNPSNSPIDGDKYVFNDGDGSTRYDVEMPIQLMSFDPDFHDASLNVQPLPFAAMRDKYFLMNGRGYPDTTLDAAQANATVGALPLTIDPLGNEQASQPESSLITAAPGDRILLRFSNVSITNFTTVGTVGLTMQVVGWDSKILRDDDGNNMYYDTNSITLGGGSTAEVIITAPAVGTYFVYSKNLDQLSNDAENFGGMMTEIRIQ